MAEEPLGPTAGGDDDYRSCAECGRDCEPEPFTSDEGIRISFACAIHGVHTVVDPFEHKR